MSKSTKVEVGTPAVRAWAAEQGEYAGAKFLIPREGESAARGRVPNAVIEAYQEATGNVVVTGHKSARTVTLTPRNAKGRKLKPREVTLARARELAGEVAGERGALSKVAIEAAEEALSAELAASRK